MGTAAPMDTPVAFLGLSPRPTAGPLRAGDAKPHFIEPGREIPATSWIEGFLGQPLSESRVQQLEVHADVTATSTGFTARILVTTERGRFERQLEHADCSKLVEAAAFVIALSIDPERVQGKAPPGDASVAGAGDNPATGASAAFAPLASDPEPPCPDAPTFPEPCHCPPSPAPPTPVPPVAAKLPPPWSAGVEGLIGTGALPELGPGIGVQGAWAPTPRARIVGHGRWWTPRSRPVPGYERAEVRLELVDVGLSLCALPVAGRLEVRTCAALLVGAVSGVGVNVLSGAPKRARWTAVLGRASLAYWAGPHWGPVLGVEGGPALERPGFGVSGGDGAPIEVYRAGPWAANALLGVQFGARPTLQK